MKQYLYSDCTVSGCDVIYFRYWGAASLNICIGYPDPRMLFFLHTHTTHIEQTWNIFETDLLPINTISHHFKFKKIL